MDIPVGKEPTASRERTFECKVYYEDTDCMGVVYHANYLKYLERARWEYLEDRLMSILDYNERGYSFMVHKIQMVFHSPAKLGDLLVIRTWIESTTRFTVAAKQIIIKKGESRDLFGDCHNYIRYWWDPPAGCWKSPPNSTVCRSLFPGGKELIQPHLTVSMPYDRMHGT